MNVGNATTKIAMYMRHNWFKIGIALILVFILTKKDLTFNINLRAPARQAPPPQEKQVQPTQKAKNKEVLTESAETPVAAEVKPKKELFDMSLFGKKSAPPKAIDELAKVDEATKQAYLKRFARVAVSESGKFNIPASVILANALLQSQGGTRELAEKANNQFGLPCTHDWQGDKTEVDGNCYRKYENAWTSFRDHSFYVTTGSYASLRKIARTDYKAWAKALEKAGFSGEEDLAKQLVKIIEEYELTKLDQ